MYRLQHFLLKLSEEANEVSLAILECDDSENPSLTEIHNELNDLFAIVVMLNMDFCFKFGIDKHFAEPVILPRLPNPNDLLIGLVSACNRLGQIAAKTMQFGFLERHPELEQNNVERIHVELISIIELVKLLNGCAEFGFQLDDRRIAKKISKVEQYFNYSVDLGCVSRETPRNLYTTED